jgi:hypothetical protein
LCRRSTFLKILVGKIPIHQFLQDIYGKFLKISTVDVFGSIIPVIDVKSMPPHHGIYIPNFLEGNSKLKFPRKIKNSSVNY